MNYVNHFYKNFHVHLQDKLLKNVNVNVKESEKERNKEKKK